MHELIAALVHAGNRDDAIREAHRVFLKHTGPTYQSEACAHFYRFDAYCILDLDEIEELNIWLEQMMKKTSLTIVETIDSVGELVGEKIPPDKNFTLGLNYREYYRGTPTFLSPTKDKPQPIPGVIARALNTYLCRLARM